MFRPLRVCRAALTALSLCLPLPALAGGPPDEGALRYYASLGQKDRVAAEARRLSRLDPAWHMPDDLYSAAPGRDDEGPLWTLFSSGKMDDLQAAIAARQKAEPRWQPSQDLVTKIAQRNGRAMILHLAQTHAWHEIVQDVKERGSTWAKDDAEVLWIIAEAYAREDDCAEAYGVYSALLANHADPKERLGTIEHAMAMLPMTFVEKLIAMGHAGPDGRSEFDAIGLDITRARISAFLHDEIADPVSGRDLASFETYVRGQSDPNQSGLAAWYAFKRHDYRAALTWFKLSIAHGGDAMIAHGLAHTLNRLGLKREAEDVAYAWREPLINNAILFVDLGAEDLTADHPRPMDPARIERYAQVVTGTSSGEGAQALGWYAYNTCQFPLALEWFARAAAWMPKESTVLGYALTLRRLKRTKEFRDIVNRYDGLFPKVVALAFRDTGPGAASACDMEPASGRSAANGINPAAPARPHVPSPGSEPVPEMTRTLGKTIDFPVSVASENPLRFSALHTVASEDQAARGVARMPLIARRVPGAGAMPYERFGFSLMPGWDGSKEASSPPVAERPAAAGTQAADDAVVPGKSTVSSSAPTASARREMTGPARGALGGEPL